MGFHGRTSQKAGRQPHWYFMSGFLHSGLPHLLVNIVSLCNTPDWLETGLGWRVFFSTESSLEIICLHRRFVWVAVAVAVLVLSKISVSEPAEALPPCTVSNVYCTEQNSKRQDWTACAFHVYFLLQGVILPDINNASHIGGFYRRLHNGLLVP